MSGLIKYEAACRALAEAKAVDEVKDLRDKADAMRIYAMQAKNKSLEIDAAEIRIRAERRLGEMIAAQKAGDGLNKGGNPSLTSRDQREVAPTLKAVGISHDLSSRAQKLAAVPAAEFEAEVGQWRERVSAENKRVTTRLEMAGEKALEEELQAEEMEAFGPSEEEIADAEKAEAEQLEYIKNLLANHDDPLTKALADVKMYRERAQTYQILLEGEKNKNNELIRMVKALQAKLRKVEA